MKLGLIIYADLETLSGGYRYDRRLVEHLRNRGDRVEVISLPWRNYAIHLMDNLSTALRRKIEHLRVDVLLQDELNHPSLFWTNRRMRRSVSYPLVSIVHHLRSCEARPAWQNILYRGIERMYLSTVNGFVFNSQTTRREVEKLSSGRRSDPPPALVAFPGRDESPARIRAEEIARRARQTGPLRLLFVGNVIPRKGLHVLLSALEQLSADDFRLEVVGDLEIDPAYARKVQTWVYINGLEDRVTFLGKISEAELADRMRSAHLMAVPSSYEGFGIIYLEGMGSGLPALASARGAAQEIVTEGETGFLIEPGDSAALQRYLQILHADRDGLIRMSLAALRRYESHPTWEQTASRIRNFLHGL